MENKKKIRRGWLAFTFVIFHFGAIFLFALPDHWIPVPIKSGVSHYVNPIFYQKWNLFAPCPVINAKVEANYYFSETDSSNWIRPVQDALNKHKIFRFTHHGELALGESNMLYFLYNDLYYGGFIKEKQYIEFDGIPSHSDGFGKLKKFVFGYGRFLFEESIIKADIRCDFIDVTNDALVQVMFINVRP